MAKIGSLIAALINDYDSALRVHIYDEDGEHLDDEQKRELEEADRDVLEARRELEKLVITAELHTISPDRMHFIIEHEEELVEVMNLHGGNFAAAIAVAYRRADGVNRAKLRDSFGDMIYTYKKFLREKSHGR